MDLDEFKEKWAEQDRKLDTSLRLNREILKGIHLGQARTELQYLVPGLVLETVLNFLVIMVLGNFIYEHFTQVQYALPAILLDASMITLFGLLIRQILIIYQFDPSQPIATLQKQMGTLRLLRIRSTQWVLIASPLLWTPLLVVAIKGFLGLNAYQMFGIPWLAGNLFFGIIFLALAIWLSKRFRKRMASVPLVQYLADTLAGDRLKKAMGFLKTLSEFVDE